MANIIHADPIPDVPPARILRLDVGGVPHEARLYRAPGTDPIWQITAELAPAGDDGVAEHNHIATIAADQSLDRAAADLDRRLAQQRGLARPHLDAATQVLRHKAVVAALAAALAADEGNEGGGDTKA